MRMSRVLNKKDLIERYRCDRKFVDKLVKDQEFPAFFLSPYKYFVKEDELEAYEQRKKEMRREKVGNPADNAFCWKRLDKELQ